MNGNNLEQLAIEVVEKALAKGVTAAEVTTIEGDEFSVSVRQQEVENLKESGSRGAGLRVLMGRRSGSSYTSDLSEDGIRHMVESAVAIAKLTSEDPFAGLPEPEALGALQEDLRLFHEEVLQRDTAAKIAMAMRAEKAALDFDPRIANSEGATLETYVGRRAFANSLGFAGSYRSTNCALSVVPVAREGESMERDYWFTSARSFGRLEPEEEVGRIAAQRAIRRLGARKVPTQVVPVVLEPRVARTLVSNVFSALTGEAVYRKASFLAEKMGEVVASPLVSVVDDGTMPEQLGTTPFDDEGVCTRVNRFLDKGVLRSFALNSYTGRKLGLATTGNASRGLTGNAGIGHGNLFLERGTSSVKEILAQVKNGFYVTELMGSGVNIVTGDYSRGAAGMWIESGEFAYPVSEVTIAGNLLEMFQHITAVGNDLELRGSVASPTLLIGEMTVGGN